MRLLIGVFILSCLHLTALQTLTLTPEEESRIGLKTSVLSQKQYEEQTQAYGTVIDPSLLLQARSKWVQAQAQWLKARQALFYSETNYLRQKQLYEEDQIASQKAFQMAEDLYKSNQIDEESSCLLLEELQKQLQEEWGLKIAGWIMQESPEYRQLAVMAKFLIQVSLPPGKLISPMPEKAFIEPYADIVMDSFFVSPARVMNNQMQNFSFYYMATPSEQYPLIPGMNVKASLPNKSQLTGVEVPMSAIVWWQGKPWVYVMKGSQNFSIREITNQYPTNTGLFVEKELKAGDHVVTTGAQELLSSQLVPKHAKAQAEPD